jgi:hypothetical protein
MTDHEPDSIPIRRVAGVLAATAVATAIAAWIAYGLAGGEHHGEGMAAGHDVSGVETSPFSVEAQGFADHAAAETRLSTYGWVDRDQRIVHVPVDVAIDVLLRPRADRRVSR